MKYYLLKASFHNAVWRIEYYSSHNIFYNPYIDIKMLIFINIIATTQTLVLNVTTAIGIAINLFSIEIYLTVVRVLVPAM